MFRNTGSCWCSRRADPPSQPNDKLTRRHRGYRVLASNGEALTVLDATDAGLTVRNNRSGVEGSVPWRKLQDDRHAPVRLGYASANTINLMQGVTATDAMTVLMDGTRGMDAYRAYVADSRHQQASVMVIDEASVRRDISAMRPRGADPTIRQSHVIQRIGENLSRQPEKDNAVEFDQAGRPILCCGSIIASGSKSPTASDTSGRRPAS